MDQMEWRKRSSSQCVLEPRRIFLLASYGERTMRTVLSCYSAGGKGLKDRAFDGPVKLVVNTHRTIIFSCLLNSFQSTGESTNPTKPKFFLELESRAGAKVALLTTTRSDVRY